MVNVNLSDEHIDYILRKFLDNLIQDERMIATMASAVELPQIPSVARGIWKGGQRIRPQSKRKAIANLNKTRKLLGIESNLKKRDKNGRFISNKRKRIT